MRYRGVKGKCWELVRKIIAKRDGDACFTCARQGPMWKYDTGHYYPVAIVGSNNRLSWDLRYIRRQCKVCNGIGQGMQNVFRERLGAILGQKALKEFETRRHKVDPVKNWVALLEEYKKVV